MGGDAALPSGAGPVEREFLGRQAAVSARYWEISIDDTRHLQAIGASHPRIEPNDFFSRFTRECKCHVRFVIDICRSQQLKGQFSVHIMWRARLHGAPRTKLLPESNVLVSSWDCRASAFGRVQALGLLHTAFNPVLDPQQRRIP